MEDKSRPSEHRGVERDIGGLLSSTKNWERSRRACRGLDFPVEADGCSSGMQEERFTTIVAWGWSPDGDGEGVGFTGTLDSDQSIVCTSWVLGDGLACMEVRSGSVSVGASCILERESGEGAVISNEDAAQSQWADREP